MTTSILRAMLTLLASATLGLAFPASGGEPTAIAEADLCTTGTTTVSAGYTIPYAAATPTVGFEAGYQPEEAWASEHLVGTYTFGAPPPLETGFAWAQFKCGLYCQNQPGPGGFFVKYAGAGNQDGSWCNCFDELIDPESFVANNQTLVGAWNPICK